MAAITKRKLDTLLFSDETDDRTFTTGSEGLMGTWEVARYLGVEKSRIARWLGEIKEGKQPIAPPVATLKSGSFWKFEDVDAKLRSMYEVEKSPYGRSEKGLRRWAQERRDKRETPRSDAVAA